MLENNSKPLISIIMPTFNRAHILGRSINSVINQTYHDWELLLVDDASSDNTSEIILSYNDNRIKYYTHSRNMGGNAARNTGLRHARGNYIAFLDSDDEWMPTKLERQLAIIDDRESEAGVIYTGFSYINGNNQVIKKFVPKVNGNIRPDIFHKNYIGTLSTLLALKECFRECGGFDETLPSCQDWDLYIRISEKYKFVGIKETMVLFHVDGVRISTNALKRALGHQIFLLKHFKEISSRKRYLSYHYYVIGVDLLYSNRFRVAQYFLRQAVKKCPWTIPYYVHYIFSEIKPLFSFYNWLNQKIKRIIYNKKTIK